VNCDVIYKHPVIIQANMHLWPLGWLSNCHALIMYLRSKVEIINSIDHGF
jgi:hypothetical protein